jgi:hypothetical protein
VRSVSPFFGRAGRLLKTSLVLIADPNVTTTSGNDEDAVVFGFEKCSWSRTMQNTSPTTSTNAITTNYGVANKH